MVLAVGGWGVMLVGSRAACLEETSMSDHDVLQDNCQPRPRVWHLFLGLLLIVVLAVALASYFTPALAIDWTSLVTMCGF